MYHKHVTKIGRIYLFCWLMGGVPSQAAVDKSGGANLYEAHKKRLSDLIGEKYLLSKDNKRGKASAQKDELIYFRTDSDRAFSKCLVREVLTNNPAYHYFLKRHTPGLLATNQATIDHLHVLDGEKNWVNQLTFKGASQTSQFGLALQLCFPQKNIGLAADYQEAITYLLNNPEQIIYLKKIEKRWQAVEKKMSQLLPGAKKKMAFDQNAINRIHGLDKPWLGRLPEVYYQLAKIPLAFFFFRVLDYAQKKVEPYLKAYAKKILDKQAAQRIDQAELLFVLQLLLSHCLDKVGWPLSKSTKSFTYMQLGYRLLRMVSRYALGALLGFPFLYIWAYLVGSRKSLLPIQEGARVVCDLHAWLQAHRTELPIFLKKQLQHTDQLLTQSKKGHRSSTGHLFHLLQALNLPQPINFWKKAYYKEKELFQCLIFDEFTDLPTVFFEISQLFGVLQIASAAQKRDTNNQLRRIELLEDGQAVYQMHAIWSLLLGPKKSVTNNFFHGAGPSSCRSISVVVGGNGSGKSRFTADVCTAVWLGSLFGYGPVGKQTQMTAPRFLYSLSATEGDLYQKHSSITAEIDRLLELERTIGQYKQSGLLLLDEPLGRSSSEEATPCLKKVYANLFKRYPQHTYLVVTHLRSYSQFLEKKGACMMHMEQQKNPAGQLVQTYKVVPGVGALEVDNNVALFDDILDS